MAVLATACGTDVGSTGRTEGPAALAAPPPDAIELTEVGACGEAWVWAASADGDVAVTVAVEARDRDTDEPTTVRFELPDPAVTVQVLRGDDLPRNFCTDLPDPDADPTSTDDVVAGVGKLVLDPPPTHGWSCGRAEVDVSLTGLRAPDGAAFAPVAATTTGLGCYAG